MTIQYFFKLNCLKLVSVKRKVGFQLWSANLVFAFIAVRQAQNLDCACSKRKWQYKGIDYDLFTKVNLEETLIFVAVASQEIVK